MTSKEAFELYKRLEAECWDAFAVEHPQEREQAAAECVQGHWSCSACPFKAHQPLHSEYREAS